MNNSKKEELKRFTTLIQPSLLSKIKLISYFTNQKLNEVINSSLQTFITDFETKNNTQISKIIDLQSNFTQLNSSINPATVSTSSAFLIFTKSLFFITYSLKKSLTIL